MEADTWTELPPMLFARLYHRCAEIEGKILVMGGVDADEHVLTSVEYYDPILNQWFTVAPMLSARQWFYTGVSNGFVYVMGGEEFPTYQKITSIEKYSMHDNNWTRVSTINKF